MKKYKCILFDLDGTLANTEQGILNSYKYAIEELRLPISKSLLTNEVIGAPLLEVFRTRFGLDDMEARQAVECYREYYAKKGWMEASLYPQMAQVLKELKRKGRLIGVTTLKREVFAIQMMKLFGIDKYIDVVYGMDGQDQLTKAVLVKRAMNRMKCSASETVLVGDSFYDSIGAQEAGVDFVGVTYGFGFKEKTEILEVPKSMAVSEPIELLSII